MPQACSTRRNAGTWFECIRASKNRVVGRGVSEEGGISVVTEKAFLDVQRVLCIEPAGLPFLHLHRNLSLLQPDSARL